MPHISASPPLWLSLSSDRPGCVCTCAPTVTHMCMLLSMHGESQYAHACVLKCVCVCVCVCVCTCVVGWLSTRPIGCGQANPKPVCSRHVVGAPAYSRAQALTAATGHTCPRALDQASLRMDQGQARLLARLATSIFMQQVQQVIAMSTDGAAGLVSTSLGSSANMDGRCVRVCVACRRHLHRHGVSS